MDKHGTSGNLEEAGEWEQGASVGELRHMKTGSSCWPCRRQARRSIVFAGNSGIRAHVGARLARGSHRSLFLNALIAAASLAGQNNPDLQMEVTP